MFRFSIRQGFFIFWAMIGLCFGLAATTFAQHPADEKEIGSRSHNPYSLNVRLNSRAIHPPKELIKHMVVLKGIQAARPRVGPPPQAAILEDDERRRVAILSTDDTGMITTYLLEDLDLEPHLPEVAQCTKNRHCAEDRMATMGGLGCIAICMKEIIEKLLLD